MADLSYLIQTSLMRRISFAGMNLLAFHVATKLQAARQQDHGLRI
jgi:hypothetical protein